MTHAPGRPLLLRAPGYDQVNQATHEHKEEIKVGYNLRRKIVLMALWAAAAAGAVAGALAVRPDRAGRRLQGYLHDVGIAWLALGVGGLLFRTVHLFFLHDVQTGLVWVTKILTDPFHDVMLYCSAPLHLLRGELHRPDARTLAARRGAEPGTVAGKRWRSISRSMPRRMPGWSAPGSRHHQPSACMARRRGDEALRTPRRSPRR